MPSTSLPLSFAPLAIGLLIAGVQRARRRYSTAWDRGWLDGFEAGRSR